jgi:hypothetical protein
MLDPIESRWNSLFKRIKLSPTERDRILEKMHETLAKPHIFDELNQWIQQSNRRILQLKENWDNEGSKGYKEDTINRASLFLRKLAESVYINLEKGIDLPKIRPGPQGSVDLYWKEDKYELLVNISEDPNEPADVYGDNYGGLILKGTFELNDLIDVLTIWLRNYLKNGL